MISRDEMVTLARIAAAVLVVVAVVAGLGVLVVLLLGATGLEAAVLLGTVVLSTLGVLVVISGLWQTYVLMQLRERWEAFLEQKEGGRRK